MERYKGNIVQLSLTVSLSMLSGVDADGAVMIRMPIFIAMLATGVPAYAASGEDPRGWDVDAGGAVFSVAARALTAIERGDVAAVNDDAAVFPVQLAARDPSRIGLDVVETGDRRPGSAIARISARFRF